jgi:uncharacterized protein (DUF927 family)
MTHDMNGPAFPAHDNAADDTCGSNAAPEAPALPEGFELRRDGLYWREDAAPVFVSGRIVATAQTRDGDGHAWGVLLEWPDDDGRAHQWVMPRALLAGDGVEVVRELMARGLRVSSGRRGRERLLDYLNRVSPPARVRVVPRLGWHDTVTGGRVFVLPEATLGDTGPERIVLQVERRDALPPIRQAGTLEEWQTRVGAVAVGNTRLAFMISAAFAPPLLGLLGADGGGFHLRCRSSSGKTSTLRAAGSVWGGGTVTGFCASWRATDNGLEGAAAAHNDLPLILDEINEAGAEDAGKIAYLVANGRGKARAGRDGGARGVAMWRTVLLSAGEVSLADKMGEAGKHGGRVKAGQEMRLLDIPGDTQRFGLFETLHGHPDGAALADALKAAAGHYYGTAGRAWLERLAADPEAAMRRAREVQAEWLAEHLPPNPGAQVRRAADYFALVAAAGEMAAGAGILPWPPGEASTAAAACFEVWRETRRGGDGDAEAAEAIERARGFIIAHGASRFEALDAHDTATSDKTVNRAGWRKGQGSAARYLIPREVWRGEVMAGADPEAAARALRDAGFLISDDRQRLVKRERVGGLNPRVYVIRATILGDDD